MTRLSVNLNKIALLRNSRGGDRPNVLEFGRLALAAGADGLTVHPRADQRHITHRDAQEVAAVFGNETEINFEGDLREDFLQLVEDCRPHQCTLVPVSPGERTSHRGWDFDSMGYLLGAAIQHLQSLKVRVSVFVNPEPKNALKAKALGADRIEIYTEPYALAYAEGRPDAAAAVAALVREAHDCGIGVNAGHDLTLDNLGPLLRAAPGILEVSIGHHLIGQSLIDGFQPTVQRFKSICASKGQAETTG